MVQLSTRQAQNLQADINGYIRLLQEEAYHRGLSGTKDYTHWEEEKLVFPSFEHHDRFDMTIPLSSALDLPSSLRHHVAQISQQKRNRMQNQSYLRQHKMTLGLEAYKILYGNLHKLGRAPVWVEEPEEQVKALLSIVGELWRARSLSQQPPSFKVLVYSDIAQEHQELVSVSLSLDSTLQAFEKSMRELLIVRHVVEIERPDPADWPYLPDSKVFLDEWGWDCETGEDYPVIPETGERVDLEYVDTGKQFIIDDGHDADGAKRHSIMAVTPSLAGLGWSYRICPKGGKEADPLGLVWKALDDETDWKNMVREVTEVVENQAVILHDSTRKRVLQQRKRAEREEGQEWRTFNPRRHADMQNYKVQTSLRTTQAAGSKGDAPQDSVTSSSPPEAWNTDHDTSESAGTTPDPMTMDGVQRSLRDDGVAVESGSVGMAGDLVKGSAGPGNEVAAMSRNREKDLSGEANANINWDDIVDWHAMDEDDAHFWQM